MATASPSASWASGVARVTQLLEIVRKNLDERDRQTAAGEDASKAGKTGQRRLGDLNGALKQLRQQLGSKAVMRYVDADELELRQAALLDLTAKAQTLQQQCDAGPQYELPTPANKRILEAQHQEIAVQDEGLDQLTNVIQRQLDIGQVWTEIVKKIWDQMDEQNMMLDELDESLDNTNVHMTSVSQRVNSLLAGRSEYAVCGLVAVVAVMVIILIVIIVAL